MLTKSQKRMFLVVVILMILPVLTGIACDGSDADKALDKAGDAVESAAQEVSGAVDDVVDAVAEEIANDPVLNVFNETKDEAVDLGGQLLDCAVDAKGVLTCGLDPVMSADN